MNITYLTPSSGIEACWFILLTPLSICECNCYFLGGKNRLHAQALTLAALAGAAVVEYYDHRSGAKQERVAKFLGANGHPHKD